MGQPYCKLYVDSDERAEDLQEVVDACVSEAFPRTSINAVVYRNEISEPDSCGDRPYDFILASGNYVDVDCDDEPEADEHAFQMGTARLISLLREGGRVVTASCNFEELIVAQTGWNWTTDNPNPPAR